VKPVKGTSCPTATARELPPSRQRRKIRSTTNDEGSEWPPMQGKQIEQALAPPCHTSACSFLLPVLGPTPPAEDSDPISSEAAAQASAAGSCGVHTTGQSFSPTRQLRKSATPRELTSAHWRNQCLDPSRAICGRWLQLLLFWRSCRRRWALELIGCIGSS
jgi:hypothetical protein